ncbi:MAG: hypothetical protein EBZ77_09490 [Chitinophagia bacterium]|nr:hypothetical protein [Chitinophagia bacterium]
MEEIGQLYSLQTLTLSENTSLKTLPDLTNLHSLRSLTVANNDVLHGRFAFNNSTLDTLVFTGNGTETDSVFTVDVDKLSQLKLLDAYTVDFVNLRNISGLLQLTHLTLHGPTPLDSIPALPKLTHLQLWSNKSITDLVGISKWPHLQELELSVNRKLVSLTGLADLKQLQTVNLRGNDSLTDLSALEYAKRLNSVRIYVRNEVQLLPNLSCLQRLNQLDSFTLNTDVPLDRFKLPTHLKYLNIYGDTTLKPLLYGVQNAAYIAFPIDWSVDTNLIRKANKNTTISLLD